MSRFFECEDGSVISIEHILSITPEVLEGCNPNAYDYKDKNQQDVLRCRNGEGQFDCYKVTLDIPDKSAVYITPTDYRHLLDFMAHVD